MSGFRSRSQRNACVRNCLPEKTFHPPKGYLEGGGGLHVVPQPFPSVSLGSSEQTKTAWSCSTFLRVTESAGTGWGVFPRPRRLFQIRRRTTGGGGRDPLPKRPPLACSAARRIQRQHRPKNFPLRGFEAEWEARPARSNF